MSIQEEWSVWSNEIHNEAKQIACAARAEEVQVLSVDRENGIMHCLGSEDEVYETLLDSCTCKDFRYKRKPCKHMYRLALECGLGVDIESGKNRNLLFKELNQMNADSLNKVYGFVTGKKEKRSKGFLEGFIFGSVCMTLFLVLNIIIYNIIR